MSDGSRNFLPRLSCPRRLSICVPFLLMLSFGLWIVGQAEDTPLPPKTSSAKGDQQKNPADETWWSLRPLVRPLVPQTPLVSSQVISQNPIDLFVQKTLAEKKLRPAVEADRRTLIRRVSLDLVGLPPTPEEVEEFVADPREDAYERLVDRLLASPHFGERWARHWMDVVHYGETHGHDQDRVRPNVWPYRDYLIRSLNEDKPYSQFIAEQVAGDVLSPDDPQAIAATGFLVTGPWDESSLQSIQDDTDDRRIAQYLDRDDIVTTVMSTFVSSTVHCARCHDHFFDPISQSDYYALQAVFAGIEKADRVYEPDVELGRRRKLLLSELARLRSFQGVADASLLTPEMQQLAAAWEAKQAATPSVWQVLSPAEVTSAEGSTLTALPDGSVLASGKRPEKETYSLAFDTPLKGITALRLEVLADDSLSKRGPGRQDNGNLHLSELKVLVTASGASATKTTGEPPVVAKLKSARADFDQSGWTISHAIDGNPGTAWGIHPKVGEDHRAIFEFEKPIGLENGTRLTIVLEQLHGRGHLIGRPRISVTTVAESLSLDGDIVPNEINVIRKKLATERTDLERAELARYVRATAVERELTSLPPPQMVFAASNETRSDAMSPPTKKPVRMVHLLTRGDIKQAKEVAQPGAMTAINGLVARFDLNNQVDEGSRRTALARWLTDHRNVLVWRSIANRIWHHHFGRGLSDTPNDFGQMGSKPSHPELHDWLASELNDAETPGSNPQREPGHAVHLPLSRGLKHLHRLVVTSATYRQSSAHDEGNAAIDADNRFLWRMNRTRLDAESVRDSLNVITGRLDRRMGGPSAKQFIETPGIHVTPDVNYSGFDPDRPENARRSVYRFIFRTLPDPLMEALDVADSSQLAATRNSTVTALQALAMLNNSVAVRQSEHLATRVAATGNDIAHQVDAAFRLTLLRRPSDRERATLTEHARQHGIANVCRVLLNSNEFLFVD